MPSTKLELCNENRLIETSSSPQYKSTYNMDNDTEKILHLVPFKHFRLSFLHLSFFWLVPEAHFTACPALPSPKHAFPVHARSLVYFSCLFVRSTFTHKSLQVGVPFFRLVLPFFLSFLYLHRCFSRSAPLCIIVQELHNILVTLR